MKLEVKDVQKDYATPAGTLRVLTNVNLSLEGGDAAAIMGPSGTGKSTLLYILGALDNPTQGTVSLSGRNISDLSAGELSRFRGAHIGFVFQDHCLLPQCTVLENVLLPTLVAPSAQHVARARELVTEVGLAARMDHRPAQLSGGEKQRVAIARALIFNPSLVLCDEPTGNLDESTAATVTALLLRLHRERNNILVAVTHSDRVASQFPVRFELSGGHLARVCQ